MKHAFLLKPRKNKKKLHPRVKQLHQNNFHFKVPTLVDLRKAQFQSFGSCKSQIYK